MPPRPPLPCRLGRLLLLCGALLSGVGCDALDEPPDDSLRGAGSIEIPAADLQFRPEPAAIQDPTPTPAQPGL